MFSLSEIIDHCDGFENKGYIKYYLVVLFTILCQQII